MTPRSMRRAIERKARKKDLRESRTTEPKTMEQLEADFQAYNSTPLGLTTSQRQIAANRENARLSTGPSTPQGKRNSSMNAVKTGLTGRTVLLPADDAAIYERHIARFMQDHKPQSDRESELVQSMADSQWRMNRVPSLEAGIYAKGRLELADQFATHELATAKALIEAEIFLKYQKELKNLGVQEGRLRRQYEKDSAELKALQSERKEAEKAPAPLTYPQNGFEFANADSSSLEPHLGIENPLLDLAEAA